MFKYMYSKSKSFIAIKDFSYLQILLNEAGSSRDQKLKKGLRCFRDIQIVLTRKFPLRGHILGVLTHTTAKGPTLGRWWNTEVRFGFTLSDNLMYPRSSVSPRLMNLRGQRVTQNTYFWLVTLTKGSPYQENIISEILWCNCRNWSWFSDTRRYRWRTQKDRQTWKLKNSYLDWINYTWENILLYKSWH